MLARRVLRPSDASTAIRHAARRSGALRLRALVSQPSASRSCIHSSSFSTAPRAAGSFHDAHARPTLCSLPQAPRTQARALSTATRAAIDRAVSSAPVVLFMKGTPETPQCGFSRATVQILGLQGVDPNKFAAFNVLEDSELRAGIKEYSDWPTIPQLYVAGEFVGGCDILVSMHQNGDLAKLLEDKGVLVPAEDKDAVEEAADKKD